MRRQTILGHDPAEHLLRDAGSERGLDPAVPVPAPWRRRMPRPPGRAARHICQPRAWRGGSR